MKYDKKYLDQEVNRLNRKYAKNSKHKLRVQGAYGGVQVQITGKQGKRGYRGYLGSGADSITTGFLSPKETLFKLYQADSQGDIKRKFKSVDGKKKMR